jgi:hypothetical protein
VGIPQDQTSITGLNAPPGALVVMDAGLASEADIDWLKSQGYRYLVVSRERTRQFNSEQAIDIGTATGDTVRGQKVLSEDGREVRLYCYSQARSQKEEAMAKRFCELFEAALNAIADGLSRHVPKNASPNCGSASAGSRKNTTASASTITSNYRPTSREK